MALRTSSRYRLCLAIRDAVGQRYFTDRVPFRYVDLPDNLTHQVTDGDTWWTIAAKYYGPAIARPSQYWWVIADFQPDPVVDPTIVPSPGSYVIVPSLSTIREKVLDEKRRLAELV